MKNLDLNKYGVQEMNDSEIREIEGGYGCDSLISSIEAGAEAAIAYLNFMENLRSI